MNKLILNDCRNVMAQIPKDNHIIVTDPPFNIGYHYNSYKDNLLEEEYLKMLAEVLGNRAAVVILYPELLHKLSVFMGVAPNKVVSWVYNSNTAKQHRDIGFYNIKPDFSKVRQPYKNPTDKRIKARIEKGILGARLYDWWNINQVKNVSKKQINHPCVMPDEVMNNIINILPEEFVVVDPFMGSGTTGIACAKANRDFIGIEIDEVYYKIACERISKAERRQYESKL